MSSRKPRPSAYTPGPTGRQLRPSEKSQPRSASAGSPYADSPDLLTVAGSLPRLHAFATAVSAAGLAAFLQTEGPLTIFAPTDRAFDKLSEGDRKALLADKALLGKVLRHHVVSGRVRAPRQDDPRTATPDFGDGLTLTSETGAYFVDGARIVKTNIRASNGIIHAIDDILFPAQP